MLRMNSGAGIAPKLLAGALAICSLTAGDVVSSRAQAHDDDGHGPTVNTAEGRVRGFEKNGVERYLGIPYAAPPVGNLRWRPPAPVKKWNDTLDATKYANTCSQVTELGAFAGPSSITEDCLYLNVFTTGTKGKKKPVFVWIHGGGNIDGESNDYDGSKLATGGPHGTETVAVILNYRLGVLGFFSHPALNSEGHLWGNYGILDIQAVLRWVQRNAAAFGGDPTRVLLGGQSAGAVDTGANQISPLATGLFNRAIYQSAPGFFSTLPSASSALSRGNAFASAAGCPGSGSAAAACLRKLTVPRILQLQGTPNVNGPYTTDPFPDGTIIPLTPEQAFSSGQFNKMPIMSGATRDEFTFITGINEYFASPQAPMTQAQYEAAVPANVLAEYPSSNYGNDPMIAYERALTDPNLCRGLHVQQLWAPQVPVYAYDFNYQNAPYYFPKMPGFKPLASHTIDIPFVFPGWHGGQLGVNLDQVTGVPRELNSAERGLSDKIVGAWTKFAATGNPNGSGNSPWPRFTASSGLTLSQNLSISTLTTPQYRALYKCDFWDPQLTY